MTMEKITDIIKDKSAAELIELGDALRRENRFGEAINAFDAAANAKDDETARQLYYVANKGRGLDGRHYMQAFDSMADTLDRSLRRTYLIKSWDELTANILENF